MSGAIALVVAAKIKAGRFAVDALAVLTSNPIAKLLPAITINRTLEWRFAGCQGFATRIYIPWINSINPTNQAMYVMNWRGEDNIKGLPQSICG
jgi:hypothetical protein